MNCQEVQLQLSGYLEKSLDAIRMKGVETHLASCPFCRAEAHGLSDCIALVRALPGVEPPPGFAQRVMAHAREIETEAPFWKRLFGILPTTIPIQATAVLLVGVLAVLVYQREPRLKHGSISETNSPTQASRPEPQSSKIAENAENLSTQLSHPARTRSESTQFVPASPGRSKSDSPAVEPIAAPPTTPDSQPEQIPGPAVAVPRRPTIRAQEVSTGREPARPNADVFGLGALNRQPLVGAPFAERRMLSPLSEPSADFEFIVRRRTVERREAAEHREEPENRREATAAIASAAAQRAVPAPATPSSSIVVMRLYTVAPHHFEQFRKELASEAIIESEKRLAAVEDDVFSQSARDLLVKIVILPSER